jgi:hypothetical protein
VHVLEPVVELGIADGRSLKTFRGTSDGALLVSAYIAFGNVDGMSETSLPDCPKVVDGSIDGVTDG